MCIRDRLFKKGMDDFREVFNKDKIGGAPFLGIAKPVIKAHGSSNDHAGFGVRNRLADSVHHRNFVGRAVRLDDRLCDAEERRAADLEMCIRDRSTAARRR